MLVVIARTFILYGVVILIIRIMGKRQVGELQPFELAITIMVSALAAIPMEDIGIPLLFSLIPILLMLSFQFFLSLITLHYPKARGIICGKPSVVIKNGQFVESELKKLRININDLLEQLRIKGHPSLETVEYGIMETTGQLSIIPKSQKRPLTASDLNLDTDYEGLPESLIIDGYVLENNLKQLGLTREWLDKTLQQFNIEKTNQVLFAALDTRGNLIFQEKEG
ncbi:MAG: DUF421 domain-containing protein [Bacillota bacterium]